VTKLTHTPYVDCWVYLSVRGGRRALMERLQRGDTVNNGRALGVIVKIGRGQIRSAYIVWNEKGRRPSIVTEIDWWQQQGTISFVARKPQNLKFAREYCAQHAATIPDL